ncbi:MAG: TetR/AcrR family transcriptional regulator [Hyphomicrobiales bacterium]
MNQENREQLLVRIRQVALSTGVNYVSIERLCHKLEMTREELFTYFKDEEELMTCVLEHERSQFEQILAEVDFTGKNAIETLLSVSKEMSQRFELISPKVTHGLIKYFPHVYEEHFNQRKLYIFDKLKFNLEEGIEQGLYRKDFNPELISRLYMSRLIDLHNPELFPPEEFSYDTVYKEMIDSFIRGIVTPEGLEIFIDSKSQYE